ncbi:MAG: phosphatidylethanolamine-binding protein (PEBP) family uncharacterized protein [Parasphingorhabdus sp.]|jgi:phosphatidylethanolamine-binding protein (PEBP) family uncharacterized protein
MRYTLITIAMLAYSSLVWSADLTVTSSAFSDGQTIPKIYSCDGDDTLPPLEISHVPDGAKSLAIIMDDPDAPGDTWVHWNCLTDQQMRLA